MARKRTKEEAKKRLEQLPDLPGFLTRLPGPVGLGVKASKAAQGLAGLLIEVDPLNRLAEPALPAPADIPIPPKVIEKVSKVDRNEVVMRMVNDPGIKIDKDMAAAINDDSIMMAPTGELMQRIAVPGMPMLPGETKKRKRSKNDRLMSQCLREANARLRTKSGKLRKGKTQRDVMILAQRLCKKAKK